MDHIALTDTLQYELIFQTAQMLFLSEYFMVTKAELFYTLCLYLRSTTDLHSSHGLLQLN